MSLRCKHKRARVLNEQTSGCRYLDSFPQMKTTMLMRIICSRCFRGVNVMLELMRVLLVDCRCMARFTVR
jgi:hypothetical protein